MLVPTEASLRFFWERVTKQDDGCWVWSGSRARSGYPVTYVKGADGKTTKMSARRFAYQLLVDDTEVGGIQSCRTNPLCVNPDHAVINHSCAGDLSEADIEKIREGLQHWWKFHRQVLRPKVSMY